MDFAILTIDEIQAINSQIATLQGQVAALQTSGGGGGGTGTSVTLKANVVPYTYDPSGTPGNITLNGAGFTPKAAIVLMGQANTKRMSVGFAVGSGNQESCVLTTGTSGNFSPTSSYLLFIQDSVGSIQAGMSWSSWTGDGMVVTTSKNGTPTGAVNFSVLYLG